MFEENARYAAAMGNSILLPAYAKGFFLAYSIFYVVTVKKILVETLQILVETCKML